MSNPVLCSLQGSFAPPHNGHKELAELVGGKLLEVFPAAESIQVLFMPVSDIESKESVKMLDADMSHYVSQEDRKHMLQIYCDELNAKFVQSIRFGVSTLEYELQPTLAAAKNQHPTATIHTIDELKRLYPHHTLVLALGEDNARSFPWWHGIQEWPSKIDALMLLARDNGQTPTYTTNYTFKEVYQGSTQTSFAFTPWSPTIRPSWDELRADTSMQNALQALAKKTYLLPKPSGHSSSALRSKLHDFYRIRATLEDMCGKQVAEYLVAHDICKPVVKGGRRTRTKKKKHAKSVRR
jgi:nicotinic acid mononucleotide adenylyltransferase